MTEVSPVKFWVKTDQAEGIKDTRKHKLFLELRPCNYAPYLSAGSILQKDEIFARTNGGYYVRGEVKPWDALRDCRCLHVLIGGNESPLLVADLYMTQYSWINVQLEKGKQLINQKRRAERVEMLPGHNFIDRAFQTFDFFFAQRSKKGYTPRLLLFDSTGQIDEHGNMASPTPAADVYRIIEELNAQKQRPYH